jgi:hypothetical protein
LVTSKLTAGRYNFDPNTPEEHGYTDIGWYAVVSVGDGTLNVEAGTVRFPVKINGNNGLSAANFNVTSAVPINDILDANGAKLDYRSSYDNSASLYSYIVSFKEAKVKIVDHDLFYLVIKGDAAVKAEDYKISLSYADALNRIGHSTKLYMGSRPDPSQTDNRRQGL